MPSTSEPSADHGAHGPLHGPRREADGAQFVAFHDDIPDPLHAAIRDHHHVGFEYGTGTWADQRLAAAGLTRTGAVGAAPRAAAPRIPKSGGAARLKATDPERGWPPLPHRGPSLGDRARALVWQRAIRAFGSEDWRSAPGEWLRSVT